MCFFPLRAIDFHMTIETEVGKIVIRGRKKPGLKSVQ